MTYSKRDIERFLFSCRDLRAFCSQNGWIDNDTLYFEIVEQNDHQVIALVQFEEILMEGSGRVAGRVPCQGRLRLILDRFGEVSHAELL